MTRHSSAISYRVPHGLSWVFFTAILENIVASGTTESKYVPDRKRKVSNYPG